MERKNQLDTNFTHTTPRSYADLQNLPNIPTDATIDSNINAAIADRMPLADANISSATTWNAKTNWTQISSLFPVPDANLGNISGSKVMGIVNKLINGTNISLNCTGNDGNGTCTINTTNNDLNWAALNTVVPWTDANVADDITLTNLTQITTRSYADLQNLPNIPTDATIDSNINAAIADRMPLADANISSATTWNAKTNWTQISSLFPVPDANLGNISGSKVMGIVNKLINGTNISLNCTGNDGNGTCTINTTNNDLNWAALNTVVPWTDANVADDITLTNLTQITTRSYADLQNLPNIPTDATIDSNINAAIADRMPLADANISSATTWNAKTNWTQISSLFPVPDANLGNISGSKVMGIVNKLINGTNISLNCTGNDGNGTCTINTTNNDLNWAALNTVVPWTDANVADDITLTNLTQITTRSYADLQNLPNIPTDATIDSNINAAIADRMPLADANISSATTWNAKTNWTQISHTQRPGVMRICRTCQTFQLTQQLIPTSTPQLPTECLWQTQTFQAPRHGTQKPIGHKFQVCSQCRMLI